MAAQSEKTTEEKKTTKLERVREMRSQIRWIYGYGRKHLLSMGVYTLLGLSSTVVGLFMSLVSRDLVDIITGHKAGELVKTFVMMIAAQITVTVINAVSSYVTIWISTRVEQQIKADVYDQIMNTEWEALSVYHSGDILSRWGGDCAVVASGILSLIPNAIIFFFRFVAALYMVCRYDASFALFALFSVPISLLTSQGTMRSMRKRNLRATELNAKMSAFTQESFANTQNVKALDMVKLYRKKLRLLQDEHRKMRLGYQRATSLNSILMTVVSQVVSYSTYGWGIYKVWSGQITYGSMTMFLTLSTSLAGTTQSLIGLVPSAISLTNAAGRVMKLLNLPREDESKVEEVKQFFEAKGEKGLSLVLKGVSYAYASGTEVLDQVDFEAHPHEVVALIGPSGEGKTTILRYLLSIIRSEHGQSMILAGDGQDAAYQDWENRIPLSASTRQLFAYVPQGNTMFTGTIAENMRNVKEDATDEEIIAALKLACAWDFVEKLPDGIETMVQERGGGFSEGQAQRLAIARALIRKSPILLLDEATSALDMETERRVLHNIMADDYPRTCIVTTHRPAVMEICSRVYTIKNKQLTKSDSTEME